MRWKAERAIFEKLLLKISCVIQQWGELKKVWDVRTETWMKLINSSRAGNSKYSWVRKGFKSICCSGFLDLEALISYNAGDLLLWYALSPQHVHLVENEFVLLEDWKRNCRISTQPNKLCWGESNCYFWKTLVFTDPNFKASYRTHSSPYICPLVSWAWSVFLGSFVEI